MSTLPLTALMVLSALAGVSPDELPGAAPAAQAEAASAGSRLRDLSAQVNRLLEQAAGTRGASAAEMVPRLVEMYEQIGQESALSLADRKRLQLRLKTRLARYQSMLEKRKRSRPAQDHEESLSGGGSFGNAGELIDLIRTTIAPGTWDVEGGRGRIFYFRGALIIRQSDEAHTEIASALQQIRR